MKNSFKILFALLGILMLTMSACKKDEDMVVAKDNASSTFTASATNLVLKQDLAKDTVLTYSWPATDFGYDAIVNYTIEFALKGTNFTDTEVISAGSLLKKDITAAELNALIGRLDENLLGQTVDLDTRLVAKIGTTYNSKSTSLPLTVDTYSADAFYPSLYVAGDYQGWSPSTAPRVSTGQATDTKIYSGYIYIEKATGSMFKFTSAPNWDNTNYGGTSDQSGTGASGTLSSKGGDLNIAASGYYKLDADLNTNTWKALKTEWAVVGDATPAGWPTDTSAPYQVMTYNPTSQTFTITLDLTAGEMKFRANNKWDLNYGPLSKDVQTLLSGKLKEGGENIKITEAGNYTITLNLSVTGNYKYKLVKN